MFGRALDMSLFSLFFLRFVNDHDFAWIPVNHMSFLFTCEQLFIQLSIQTEMIQGEFSFSN